MATKASAANPEDSPGAALQRGNKLTAVQESLRRPIENAAFMRDMAKQQHDRRLELAANGQLITAQELAERLAVSPQAIHKALKLGRLFALEGDTGHLLYPAFYADGELARRDVEAITRTLGTVPPSSKWQFFTTPKASLGDRTPLKALKDGDRQAVMTTAAGFAER